MNYLNDINISYIIMYDRIYIIKEYINDSLKNIVTNIYQFNSRWNNREKRDIILNFIFNDYNCEYYMISLFNIKNKKTNSY